MVNIFEDKIKGDLKSLYIIDDDTEDTINSFFDYLSLIGIKKEGASNILFEEYDSFNIEKSRNIKKLHSERDSGDNQIFIIKVKYFTHEAQNALLKLFEDTKEKKHFFIFCKNVGQFLDTVLSRAVIINIETNKDDNTGANFLKKNKNDRIAFVEKIIKEHKSDNDSAGLRHHAREFIDGLEMEIYKNNSLKKEDAKKMSQLLDARKYLSSPGASVKMILEHLSLVL